MSTGSSLDWAYNQFNWDATFNTVTFQVETHDTNGNISLVELDYDRNPSFDKSNAFVTGVISHNNTFDYPGQTVTFKLLQYGIESDGETPYWAVKQEGMGFLPIGGTDTDLSTLNVKEGTGSKDPVNGSEITFQPSGNFLHVSQVGFSPYYVKADYYNVNHSTLKGTVNWSVGAPAVKPGTQMWTNP
jgi:hypothetical protein